MDFLGVAYHGLLPGELLTGLVYEILKMLSLGAAALVIAGTVTSCLCRLCECHKWRECHGRTEMWQLMH
jgi:hypothetical protein